MDGALRRSPWGQVGWDRDPAVRAWAGRAPLAGDVTADACVVGLGASGLAAIEELTRRGLSTVGVDAGRVGAAAAGRNGGFLLAGTAPGLVEAAETWGRDAAVELYRATADELDRQEDLLGPSVIRRVGSYRLAGLPGADLDDAEAADRAAELEDCERQAAMLAEIGAPPETYDGPLGRGLRFPRDAACNPARRVVELAARSAGTLHEHTVVTGVGPGVVECRTGTVRAPVVVVATDGRLTALVPGVPVRTARLQMLATAPLTDRHRLPCPVYARWGYDYAQQLPNGTVFVGGARDRHEAAEWTDDPTPTSDVQRDIEQVAARMAGGPVTVTDRWAASVGFTADGRPVTGVAARSDDGVVAACGGYSGTGNLVGMVAARAAVAAAVDGTPVPAWALPPA
ncbi:NAD(P)/FAD-dependent oxidoreductase [Jatrophihabitans sp. YIM 134969]